MAQIDDRRVLVTGATGFAGRALLPALTAAGWWVRATARRASLDPTGANEFVQADLAGDSDFGPLVDGMNAIVHLAARVHVMRDTSADPLAAFRAANVRATAQLADAAIRSGVGTFVFASSVKVNGEGNAERAYREQDPPAPQDPYGQSKLEAEQALQERAAALAVTVLRPPLMYGAGVKGNFARLVKLVRRGFPIPLGSATNRRSLLFVGNFASAVVAALERPAPGSRTYLLSDADTVTVAELIRRLGKALERPAHLVPFPLALMRAAASFAGMQGEVRRLTDPLLVDASLIRRELHWMPPYSLDQGLALTVKSFA